jgi:hypothetical protein
MAWTCGATALSAPKYGEQVPEESITSVNDSQFLAKGVGSESAWLFSQVRMPGTLSGGGRM